jgi:hypothetical protein
MALRPRLSPGLPLSTAIGLEIYFTAESAEIAEFFRQPLRVKRIQRMSFLLSEFTRSGSIR